jgi:hypothetical protein
MFLSAQPGSSVVGATASLLLEIDEAQDVSEEKFAKDFRPMASTANTTTVLYGTAWSNDTMLARQRAANLRDDPSAHFEFSWTVLAALSPDYQAFVSSEIRRLGEDHPIVRTQYRLETIDAAGRLFGPEQLALLQGGQGRMDEPLDDEGLYVAGVDIAGAGEALPDAAARGAEPRRDSTVVTIARVTRPAALLGEPLIEVVQHHWWTGRDHSTQYAGLLELLQERWGCRLACVDGTGVGAGVASWLERTMGDTVEVVQFTRPAKSELGYELLAAVNARRLRMYKPDGSPEWQEFWQQTRSCRYALHANNALNFYVEEKDGHDDFVVSLALCVRAASQAMPEPVSVIIPPRPLFMDGRY